MRTRTAGTATGALNYMSGLLHSLWARTQRSIHAQESAADTAQTLTISAPGAGLALHLATLFAQQSDNSASNLTINVVQDGVTKSVPLGFENQLSLTGLDMVGDENTAITIDLDAGNGGATSRVATETWQERV